MSLAESLLIGARAAGFTLIAFFCLVIVGDAYAWGTLSIEAAWWAIAFIVAIGVARYGTNGTTGAALLLAGLLLMSILARWDNGSIPTRYLILIFYTALLTAYFSWGPDNNAEKA